MNNTLVEIDVAHIQVLAVRCTCVARYDSKVLSQNIERKKTARFLLRDDESHSSITYW
jgi:hypothetical protein